MEVYSLTQGNPDEHFQGNRDKPITSQPQSQDNNLSRKEIGQPPDVTSSHYAVQYLKTTEKLFIQQNIALLEIILDIETRNRYQVLDPLGQKVFFAAEESGCCVRLICGPIRNFEMHIFDNLNKEVIRMHRHLGCVCCPFWLQKLDVFCPSDTLVGYVQQHFSPCRAKFNIFDKDDMKHFEIEGPGFFHCKCCVDINYEIRSTAGEVVGSITKQWRGFLEEGFTDADYFRLEFQRDIDVNMKMVLLGATFLIDYMYYERKK